MSRIDVQTLVLAFEKRIDALEKNPPDKISTAVIVNLLEKAIDDEIRNHFVFIIQKEMIKRMKNELEEMKNSFISKAVENVLTDNDFRTKLEKQIKIKVIEGFEVKSTWK